MNPGDVVLYDRTGLPGPQVVEAVIEQARWLFDRTMYHVRFGKANALVGEDCLTPVQGTQETDAPAEHQGRRKRAAP